MLLFRGLWQQTAPLLLLVINGHGCKPMASQPMPP